MRAVAAPLARLAGRLSRLLGRGGGTTLPGVVLLRLDPGAVGRLSNGLEHGTVLISATNGKTTTTRLTVDALAASGFSIATNRAGSNLERGIAASLLDVATGDNLGVFEVDEAALTAVARATNPAVIVLLNLFRDQLDRYGELDTLLGKWKDLLADNARAQFPATLVINADDPNLVSLVTDDHDVVWFSFDDPAHRLAELDHAADASTCRRCAHAIAYRSIYLGHLGDWFCTNCDNARPAVHVRAISYHRDSDGANRYRIESDRSAMDPGSDPTASMADPTAVELVSPLSGVHSGYNIAAAVAVTQAVQRRLGRPVDLTASVAALEATAPAFGRGEQLHIDNVHISLMLAKNPTGVNQNIRTVLGSGAGHGRDLHVLALLNDRTADGQDVSWIWDVDWELLFDRSAQITVAGDRAHELALRLRYGGFDTDRTVIESSAAAALDEAVRSAGAGNTVHVLPTYTALLDLRSVLTQRGHTAAYWDEER